MATLTHADTLATLRYSGIADDLTDSELDSLAALSSALTLDAGEILIEEGTASEHLYIIAAGSIEVQFFLTYEGSFQEICRLRRGAIVGEMAMLEGDVHSARTLTLEKSVFLTFSNRDLLAHLQAHPRIGYQLMFNLGRLLSKRLRFTNLAIRHQLSK